VLQLASTLSGDFIPIEDCACVSFVHPTRGAREATLSIGEVESALIAESEPGVRVHVLYYDDRPAIQGSVSIDMASGLARYSEPAGSSPLTR
jgi:hypothetical protein